MRELRSRKSTSSDTTETVAAANASPKKTTPPSPSSNQVTSSRSKDVSSSNNDANDEEEDYGEIPLFGLSELMSGVGTQNDEEVEEEEEEDEEEQEDGGGSAPPKLKRVRNPPREPVICPTCGKNFTRKAHLVRHMYLHTGEKPFKCSQCDQQFNRKDHLNHHLKAHADNKEYRCNHCHCNFRRPDLLRVHVLKNHGKYQKTFKPAATSKLIPSEAEASSHTAPQGSSSFGFKILTCTICNKRFTQEHLYKAHVALHNKQNEQNRNNVSKTNDADLENAMNAYVCIDEDERIVAEAAAIHNEDVEETFGNQEEYEDEMDMDEENAGEYLKYDGEDINEDGEDINEDEEGSDMHSHIQQMLNQLNQPRKFECVVCARVFKEQRSLRRHYKLHKRNFVCRFCGIRMSSAGSLMRHNLLHTGEKPFHCELCDRRFSRKDALKAHLVAHGKESTKTQLSRPYQCSYCSARYTMRYNLIRHIRQTHPNHRRGNAGMQQMQQQRQQIPHSSLKSEQPDEEELAPEEGDVSAENNLQCKHCGKVFANMKSLSTHVWYHNQEKRFKCKICHHGFKYATDLNRHYLTHRDKKPGNTMQIAAQTRLAQARQNVQNGPVQRAQPTHNSIMVNGQRLYPCGVCGQIFNHRSNRSRHMRLFHKGNNPAAPLHRQLQRQPPANQVIQRSFVNAASLNMKRSPVAVAGSPRKANPEMAAQLARQARISLDSNNDNDDEPRNSNGELECEYCGKTFIKRYNYKLHMRTHNKQFVCSVCGLRTASQGDLTLHIRTHTGEKPFKCSRCDWRFCRRSALTVHYRRHHGPNAKIKRHYNPQRVTPNMMQIDAEAAALELGSVAGSSHDVSDPDNGILKTMLENSPVKEEAESVPAKPNAPRKNLPPPPPLIRYPTLAPFQTLKNALTVHKVEIDKQEDGQQQDSESNPEVVFLCRPCGTLIPGKDEYVEHMLQEHGTTVSVASGKQNNPRGSAGPPSLQQRPKLLQQKPQQQATACRQCGEMFGSRHDLTVHVLVAHSSEDSAVTCGICRKNCSNIGFLSRHYQYVHPDVSNAAEEARLLLLNTTNDDQGEDEVYMDMDSMQEEADPASLLCPEVVIQEEEAGEDENNEELYQEEEYDEEFPAPETVFETESSSQQEQQPLDPNLPFLCPICNKAFKDKKALADHKWYHGREPIHPCTICGKRFKLKNDLIRHHRRHLQERPHPCPEEGCESRFYQKLDLDRHLAKVHNQLDSMPFPCQHCTARFAQPATLVRHMRSSHPGKDISQLLIIQMHAQKKKSEERQMQEYLTNLPGEEEEQEGVVQEDNVENGNDYTFELQQLEIDMSNEEEGNAEFLQDQQHQSINDEEQYEDDDYMEAHGEVEVQEAEGEELQYEEDPNVDQEEYWLTEEQNEDETSLEGSLLQPCMKRLEEYTNEQGELFCKPCNKQFKDLKTLQNHVYYHQREPKHPCTHCGAKFKQKSDLRRHISIHHDPDKRRQCIPCPNCNRSFTDERYLRIHLNRNCEGLGTGNEEAEEYNQESYEDMQEQELDPSSMMEADMNQTEEYDGEEEHQQEQEVWEEEPDPMMFVASALQTEADGTYGEEYEEEYVEDGQNEVEYEQAAFDCDICGAIFSRSNELILHKRNHAKTSKTFPFTSTSATSSTANKKSKIFTCDKCGSSFIQKAELTQHLQTYHLDELPIHQCQYCPKFFYVKKSLDTHRRRHHSHLMNLHPCKVCGAKFSQVEYLATHMKSHHSNK